MLKLRNLTLILLFALGGCAPALMQAARKNDRDRVSALIDSGADVNQSLFGVTALAEASAAGHVEMVKLLLEKGADPNAADINGWTPLTWAEMRGRSDVASILREAGAREAAARPAAAPAAGLAGSLLGGAAAPRASAGGLFAVPPAQAPSYEAPAPRSAARVSDVDRPAYKLDPRPADYALIIGVEQYSKLPSASYAERDADAVRRHLEAMGLPSRNIIHLKGQAATRGTLQGYLEEWLPRNVKPESTLFLYFSGHGAPDPKTGEAFLVPWDGDAMFLQSTAYPLKQLYSSLTKLKAKEIVIALDSCFSGAGGRSVLAAGARPLVTKVDEGVVPQGNMTLFAAASGDEITGSLDEEGHGAFTYYFLKGLAGAAKDSSGAVTAKSLFEYLKPNVQDEASRQNREQTPHLVGAQDRTLVKF